MTKDASKGEKAPGVESKAERQAGPMERYNSVQWIVPEDCGDPAQEQRADSTVAEALMRRYNG
jgi:hypothetical protein